MADKQKIEPRNPKGMRDFLPTELRVREAVLDQMKSTFKLYGFEQLETPAVELKETLTGKIGTEEKLIYNVSYRGEKELALRYDLTVPLARVIAQNPDLTLPFKRYQTQAVYRADNPQKGRFRQFLQVDIDTVGSSDLLADAEIITCAIKTYQNLGLSAKMLVNSRALLLGKILEAGVSDEMKISVAASIDKIGKIGRAGVISELVKKGLNLETASRVMQLVGESKPDARLTEIFDKLSFMGLKAGEDYKFDPYLARGLDYYTETIFEADVDEYKVGSVGGGGRFDYLIGKFASKDVPAVGFSFGFDRILEAMAVQNLLPEAKPAVKVLVTIFRDEPLLMRKSAEAAEYLRSKGVATELFTGNVNLENQLKYADRKGIPFAVIIGPAEAEANLAKVKNLATTEQQTLSLTDLASAIS